MKNIISLKFMLFFNLAFQRLASTTPRKGSHDSLNKSTSQPNKASKSTCSTYSSNQSLTKQKLSVIDVKNNMVIVGIQLRGLKRMSIL